jgi:hypothetical protein
VALRSSHVASYNLASALVHLQRLVEAAEILRSILRASDVDAPTREAAQQLLLQTEPGIGSLTVRISGDMHGVSFLLDSRPLELTAQVQTISVDPGEHVLVAQRAEKQLAVVRATVGGRAPLQAELLVELPPALAPSQAVRTLPGARREPGPPPRRTEQDESADSGAMPVWLWAAGGMAVAAAAVVTVLVVAGQGEAPQPVEGDTEPKLVQGRVR